MFGVHAFVFVGKVMGVSEFFMFLVPVKMLVENDNCHTSMAYIVCFCVVGICL